MKRTAVYVRVSTTSQSSASQRREIQKWLDGHRIKNAEFFTDAKTGDNLKRPSFERLQKAIFNGEIDCVVVYKLDRISRNLGDGINTLIKWIEQGVRVVSVTQQLDFSGATGQLVASVLFAVAAMEQETRRERQAAGIAAAKDQGKYWGRKPGATKAKPARAAKLREKGNTVAEIAQSLGVSERTVHNYLSAI